METLYPATHTFNSNLFKQEFQSTSTNWSTEDNKMFESCLAFFDKETPDRWIKVASVIPGKTVFDVIEQYKKLVADICDIEAGLFPLPGDTQDSSFTMELAKIPEFNEFRKRPLACRSSDQEKKKGVPWTEDEHRVLLVDDDFTWLKIVEQMLTRCNYLVTRCSQATSAINLLQDRKSCFDLVLIDVHTPDMDGFKLLELIGLEMNLPVIMMSAYGRTSAIIRGIRHGACDYLIKPIREEELKNIWQHVIRKTWNETKKQENPSSLDEKDQNRRGTCDLDAYAANEGSERIFKDQKISRDIKQEDGSKLDDDISSSKKPRVLWSVELHQKFVIAVNQLGIEKAVPRRILEQMNAPGLTRENVASHLQKFRLYFRRLSVPQQQMGIPNSFYGHVEQDPRSSPLEIFDRQTFVASRQIPPQTLTDLHAELLGRPTKNVGLPETDQQFLLQGSQQGQKNALGDAGVAHRQPPSLLWGHFLHIFPAIFLIFSVIWLIIELSLEWGWCLY